MKRLITGMAVFVAMFMSLSSISNAAGTAWAWRPNNASIPNRSCPSINCPVLNYVKPNTKVFVICYMDNQYFVGNYGSVRWFRVIAPLNYGLDGYIHSSYIYYQPTVPRC